MTLDEALDTLELAPGTAPEQALAQAEGLRSRLRQSLEAAPTEALKKKFRDRLAQVDQAVAAVLAARDGSLSRTQLADLPGMNPSHTAGGFGAAPAAHLNPGQVLAQRYEIRALLGAGGMGAVYAAHDSMRGKDIALKILLPGLAANPAARDRFLAEARLSSELSHPNIVNVFDVQLDGDRCFLTMEKLEGQTLRERMALRQAARKPFDAAEVRTLLGPICDALAHAHRHTIHRDIKPENIFITQDETPKLMDFGIARVLSGSQLTQTRAGMGSAYYMAPEQLRSARDVDGRADQYSLAVVAYEMLTGQLPTGMAEPIHELRKDLPRKWADAITRALSPNPEKRHPDIEAFAQAIGGGRQRGASRAPGAGRGAGKALLWGGAVAVVLALAAGAAWMFGPWQSAASPEDPVEPAAVASEPEPTRMLLVPSMAEHRVSLDPQPQLRFEHGRLTSLAAKTNPFGMPISFRWSAHSADLSPKAPQAQSTDDFPRLEGASWNLGTPAMGIASSGRGLVALSITQRGSGSGPMAFAFRGTREGAWDGPWRYFGDLPEEGVPVKHTLEVASLDPAGRLFAVLANGHGAGVFVVDSDSGETRTLFRSRRNHGNMGRLPELAVGVSALADEAGIPQVAVLTANGERMLESTENVVTAQRSLTVRVMQATSAQPLWKADIPLQTWLSKSIGLNGFMVKQAMLLAVPGQQGHYLLAGQVYRGGGAYDPFAFIINRQGERLSTIQLDDTGNFYGNLVLAVDKRHVVAALGQLDGTGELRLHDLQGKLLVRQAGAPEPACCEWVAPADGSDTWQYLGGRWDWPAKEARLSLWNVRLEHDPTPASASPAAPAG